MQNNFEKAVQQKMDELKLTPSAQVWQKVETEIAVKKRRRRSIFWFLLAALLLAGGWWLYALTNVEKQNGQTTFSSHGLPKKDEAAIVTNDHRKDDIVHKESASPKEKTDLSNRLMFRQRNDTVSTASSVRTEQTRSFLPMKNDASPNRSWDKVEKSKAGDVYKNKVLTHQGNTQTSELNRNLITQTLVQESKAKTESFPNPDLSNPSLQHTRDSSNLPLTTPAQTTIESTVDKIDSTKKEQPIKEKASAKTDTVPKRKIAAAKWRNSFMVNAGWSGYAETASGNSSSAFANYSSPPATGVTQAASSATTTGLHFSLGFSRAKKFGKRWEIAAGIQYTYASVYTKVGDKKTTSVSVRFITDSVVASGFYTNTGTTDYTARFHFIEVPVSVSFKPLLRLPLYISFGAAYGRLLSTNALTFSAASNLYYQNDQNYLRNTLPVFSAVQVGLFERKKLALRTGPFLQYNLLKLRQENTDGVPHFIFAGLKTAINF